MKWLAGHIFRPNLLALYGIYIGYRCKELIDNEVVLNEISSRDKFLTPTYHPRNGLDRGRRYRYCANCQSYSTSPRTMKVWQLLEDVM